MKPRFLSVCLLLLCIAFCPPSHAAGEYALIKHGLAPNRHFSLAVRSNNEAGSQFPVYLLREPGHQKIVPLTEVEGAFDTGADAYEAVWSPDSRHVAVLYRTERRFNVMNLYEIRGGRAYPIQGPDLLAAIAAQCHLSARDLKNPHASGLEVAWLGNTRLVLKQLARFDSAPHRVVTALGKFAQQDDTDAERIDISAEGTCVLRPGNKYHVVSVKPGK